MSWRQRLGSGALRWPDLRLRTRLAALLVAASLLPLALSAVIGIRHSQEQLLDSTKSLLHSGTEQIARELDEFHRGRLQSVERIARFPEAMAFCLGDAARHADAAPALVRLLSTFPASDPSIAGAALLDRSGRVLVASNPALKGADLSFRPYVQTALGGMTTLSDIYLTVAQDSETPSIAYAAPMRGPDGQVICVALMVIRATAIWQRIRSSDGMAGPGSYAVLFDSQGIRIAHSQSDEIVFHPAGRLEPAAIDRLVTERRFGKRTRALLEDVRAAPEQLDRARATALDREVFLGFDPVNQAPNYGVARRFETVPWTLFYMQPEAAVQAQIARQTGFQIVLALAIIAAASALGLLFARSIVRPLAALGAATSSIAGGDLSARAGYVGAGELGRLAESFNTMAERIQAQSQDLQRSRDELEQRVIERTAELEHSTEQLRTEVSERQRAEAAIRESQQLLQAVIDNSAAVIYVKDLQGRYLLVNRRYTEVFGRGSEAVLGRSDHELFSKADADSYRGMDERVAAGNAPLTEEETVPHPDGPHTYLSVKCPLRDSHGLVYGVFGISTDITDRKTVEHALRASEERTRLIVDTALDAVVTMDSAGLITGWSPQAETTFGWKRNEAMGRPLETTIIPARYREAHRQGLRHYLATGEGKVLNRRIELSAVHRDGREFPIDLAITPIRTDGHVSFSAFARDITDRKHAQAHQQAQLERLMLLDQITRAIGERQDLQSIYQVAIRSLEVSLPVDFACVCRYDPLDSSLTVIRVGANSQALALEMTLGEESRFGIDQNGVARAILGELVYEPDVQVVPFPFPQRLARGGLRSVIMTPLQSESRIFGILVVARRSPEAFVSGECEFVRQLSTHVALAAQQAELHEELQLAYDDLRQTQQTVMQHERMRALGEMASGIAHDINNALSPMALYTQSLLEREPNLTERGRGYLVTIARAVDDVAATVARLREFYRPREPAQQPSVMQLNPLVHQVLDLTRARWSDMPLQRGIVIRLETDLTPDLPSVLGVESEVREALTNLVFNAVDAMPEGGVLTLRTMQAPRLETSTTASVPVVIVEIADSGMGMDEETRRRCLEPFFTTKGERGTGLGLAMVYGVMQRHGAEINIQSATGRGTTVRLSFPIPTMAEPGLEAVPPVETALPRLRILIVDDDPVMLRSLRETLELDGHAVVAANGGQAGIDALLTAPNGFDAVITDLGMPHIDGRRVAEAVKKSSSAPPVILLTGWGQRLVAEGEIPAHVDQVLSKPPKLRELRATLARLTHFSSEQGTPRSTKESP